MGITPESVTGSLANECRAWVAEDDRRIVAFSIADRNKNAIFALFVLPEYEGRGLGSELLARAVGWLWDHEADVLSAHPTAPARAPHGSTNAPDGSRQEQTQRASCASS